MHEKERQSTSERVYMRHSKFLFQDVVIEGGKIWRMKHLSTLHIF